MPHSRGYPTTWVSPERCQPSHVLRVIPRAAPAHITYLADILTQEEPDTGLYAIASSLTIVVCHKHHIMHHCARLSKYQGVDVLVLDRIGIHRYSAASTSKNTVKYLVMMPETWGGDVTCGD
ncbi:hypothetical protein KIPB_007793, partial [Kipferlia bialata]|eukprot:g7793.t1